MSLRQIMQSRGNRVNGGVLGRDDLNSILPGVHILLPSCVDLLLRGQSVVRMAAVLSDENVSSGVMEAIAKELKHTMKLVGVRQIRY